MPKIFKGEKLYVAVNGVKANVDLVSLVRAGGVGKKGRRKRKGEDRMRKGKGGLEWREERVEWGKQGWREENVEGGKQGWREEKVEGGKQGWRARGEGGGRKTRVVGGKRWRVERKGKKVS